METLMTGKHVQLPLTPDQAATLTAGDVVLLSGTLYTARDAAHKKFRELLSAGQDLPFPTEGAVIYYCGPTPARPGQVIGSAGPTTSGRMDAYTPELLEKTGVLGMVGKGKRTQSVIDAIKRKGAVYFHAVGGAGALIARTIMAAEAIAFPELGPEAVYRLEVTDFPAIVAIDSHGNNICR
jgi:fumarate hydratase subunit beta